MVLVISERTLVNSILRNLKVLDSCYAFKVHGSLFGHPQPDIIGSYQGRALAFEVKRPGTPKGVRAVPRIVQGKPTKLQDRALEQWAAAGAITGVVFSWEQVKELLDAQKIG